MANGFSLVELIFILAIFSTLSVSMLGMKQFVKHHQFKYESSSTMIKLRQYQYAAHAHDKTLRLTTQANQLFIWLASEPLATHSVTIGTVGINRSGGVALSSHFSTVRAGTLSLRSKQLTYQLSFPVGLALIRLKKSR